MTGHWDVTAVLAITLTFATASILLTSNLNNRPNCQPIDVCPPECRLVSRKDESGCRMCDCSQEHQCQPVQCNQTCGMLRDEMGCETCDCDVKCHDLNQCSCPPCKRVRDDKGCPYCHCDHLPPKWCPNTFLLCHTSCIGHDFQGCPRCLCRHMECKEVQCEPSCGIRKNELGCDECDCPPPCPPPPQPCDVGCHMVNDRRGCHTCYCPTQSTVSQDGECSVCACPPCPFSSCPPGCIEMRGQGECIQCNCDPRECPHECSWEADEKCHLCSC